MPYVIQEFGKGQRRLVEGVIGEGFPGMVMVRPPSLPERL